MRGRDEHGARVVGQRVDDDALVVDRHRDRLEPAPREQVADLAVPGVLDRDRDAPRAARPHASRSATSASAIVMNACAAPAHMITSAAVASVPRTRPR